MQTNKLTPDRKGMSLVLRVIVTGVVLIMIAMTVVFIGTGGLRRVAGPKGSTQHLMTAQEKQATCNERLARICRETDATEVVLEDNDGNVQTSFGGYSLTVGPENTPCREALGYPTHQCQ